MQKNLPRPTDVNLNILRPSNESLTDLQKAEELIKKEMLTMISYDIVNPVQQQLQKISQSALNRANNWLQQYPYKDISEEDLEEVSKKIKIIYNCSNLYIYQYNQVKFKRLKFFFKAKKLVKEEMSIVKEGMGHGDLSLEAYTTVWDECLGQVIETLSLEK